MTKLQFRVLYREFLFRMVDLELLSAHAQGDSSKLLGQFASLLVFIGVMLTGAAIIFGGSRVPPIALLGLAWSFEHFLIATTMLVVGLFAVLSWDSTFPDRRDVLVLAPLPVRARTMFLAKVAALATALALTVGALHILAGFAWPAALKLKLPTMTLPTLAYDPAIAPVEATDLKAVLDSDLAYARIASMRTGAAAPWTDCAVAIGVSERGVRRVFTYGAARPDSVFEIASISKTFTALVLARMAAEGKVRFDEPVRELLPSESLAKPAGAEITLLDLATHHSSLSPLPYNFSRRDPLNPLGNYHAIDLYQFLARRGVGNPARATFVYSNLGYALLGQALSDRAGVSYSTLLEQEVTGPLGLHDTVVELSPEQQARFIQGYSEGRPRAAWEMDTFAPAAGIHSTAGDMLTYLEAQLHPEKFPAPLAEALVRTHQVEADATPVMRVALAWMRQTRTGTYSHDGVNGAYNSFAFFRPQGDYAAVVLVNNGPSLLSSAPVMAEHIQQRLAGDPALSLTQVRLPAPSGFGGLLRLQFAYWVTMFAAGAFIFCSVLGVQGLAAQLPRQYFLRLSAFLQMAAFCLFVCVYFLQPGPDNPAAIEAHRHLYAWLPSFWFLALFQWLSGSLHPALAPLAQRALIGLAAAVSGSAVAFLLSYFRTLRKIVEEPDITPGSRRLGWLPPFGGAPESAIVQFSIRSLFRSRQHRVILAFYLGIGFAFTIFFLKTPVTQQQLAAGGNPFSQVNAPLLASTIVMLCAFVAGTRVVFSMPLDLRANWVFRVTPVGAGPAILKARRRSLLALAVFPVWAGSAALLLTIWPWRIAAGHVVVLALLGGIVADLFLRGAQKIPFTCSYLPGKSNFHITFWFCILLIEMIIGKSAELELIALGDRARYAAMLAALAIALAAARWLTAQGARSEETLQFEEVPADVVIQLGLPRI